MSALYDTDYTAWLDSQIMLIKNKDFEHLDMEHLLEEMEDMGGLKSSIDSYLSLLILHQLKKLMQPSHDGKSWDDTIINAKNQIIKIMKKNPGLKHYPKMVFSECYTEAIRGASKQTGINIRKFPSTCPWSLNELIGE